MTWVLVGLAWTGWSLATALVLGPMLRDPSPLQAEWLARENETLRQDLCRSDARRAYAEAALAEVREVRHANVHGGRDDD